jgi:hypothetical protein
MKCMTCSDLLLYADRFRVVTLLALEKEVNQSGRNLLKMNSNQI